MNIQKTYIVAIVCCLTFCYCACTANAESFEVWGKQTREGYQGNTITLKKTATVTNVEGSALSYTIYRVEPDIEHPPVTNAPDTDDIDTDIPSMPLSSSEKEAYQNYIAAYNKLTSLMAAGKGDTPEAQAAYKNYKKAKDLYEASIGAGGGTPSVKPVSDDHHETPDKKNIHDQNPPVTSKPVVSAKPVTPHPGTSGGQSIRLRPVADSHVYAYSYLDWNKANWGKYSAIGAGWHPAGGEKRIYLRFDIPRIRTRSIGRATLKLFHYHTGGKNSLELGVYRVTSPWIEGRGTYKPATKALPGELTWINQPSFGPSPISTFRPGPGKNKYVEVDVTHLVNQWLSGAPNNGLMIKPIGNLSQQTPESNNGFHSREYKEAGKQPVLEIFTTSESGISNKPYTHTTKTPAGNKPHYPDTINSEPGQQTVLLAGNWVGNGHHIIMTQSGGNVTAIPRENRGPVGWKKATGVVKGQTVYMNYRGPNLNLKLTGTIAPGGNTIYWSNNATWTRQYARVSDTAVLPPPSGTLKVSLSGDWLGNPGGHRVYMTQTGSSVRAEPAENNGPVGWKNATGVIKGNTIHMDFKVVKLTGRISSQGNKISWSNNAIWTRDD